MAVCIGTVDDVGAEGPQEPARRPTDDERTFRRLLANSLVSGVTSSFLWFALTFWVYLETRSVVVTGVIAGAFSNLGGRAPSRHAGRRLPGGTGRRRPMTTAGADGQDQGALSL